MDLSKDERLQQLLQKDTFVFGAAVVESQPRRRPLKTLANIVSKIYA
jgi:hypothetical protein